MSSPEPFWTSVDRFLRRQIPLVSTIICLFIECSLATLPSLATIQPMLTIMAVYYWALHRPDALRLLEVFILGIIYDLLRGLPLGDSVLVFVSIWQLLLFYRRFFVGHGFYTLWIGFAIVSLISCSGTWIILAFLKEIMPPLTSIFLCVMISFFIFPFAAGIFIKLQRMMTAN